MLIHQKNETSPPHIHLDEQKSFQSMCKINQTCYFHSNRFIRRTVSGQPEARPSYIINTVAQNKQFGHSCTGLWRPLVLIQHAYFCISLISFVWRLFNTIEVFSYKNMYFYIQPAKKKYFDQHTPTAAEHSNDKRVTHRILFGHKKNRNTKFKKA